ncbi:MAG: PTS lactose transporter subunit IIB [Anaerolineae bacterium]|nr:PTS lactose transporter subunit IIB [Anaerolineae bacterium]
MSKSIMPADVETIILACEAGMGSSLMSVNALKKKMKAANVTVNIVHSPVRSIPANTRLVIVHKGLGKTARSVVPNAVIVTFSQFLNDPAFDKVVQAFVQGTEIVSTVE